MTELRLASPASEVLRAVSETGLAEFVSQTQAIEVPDDCIPGLTEAWRTLAWHWRHLNEAGAP